MFTPIKTTDFSSIRLKLASPDVMHAWSFGEVTKPETINYRTQRPEKDGLFCEKIFGPSKDWECYCGKYKKIRYKGIVCDKCGVEVTRSIVRRERMGHIDLAVPVSHIWFLRNVPSKIGLILDLSVLNLEKVIYFASFIITKVNEDAKMAVVAEIKNEYEMKKKNILAEYDQKIKRMDSKVEAKELNKDDAAEAMKVAIGEQEAKMAELDAILEETEAELKELVPMQIISEASYQELSLKYSHIFEAGIGAEAIRSLLSRVELGPLIAELEEVAQKSKVAKKDKTLRRLQLLRNLRKNNIRPEWMVLSVLPVIPPDLRPMVPLDGGRFATSDLNDLYRRVINRNNRLKQLQELKAPEVITRNEKRMLQEAVDALIDNGARHAKTVQASTGQKRMLKSLADMLKGKQGRFRANLLGKRTDYSGRSVIVVGPHLKLHQCGLPKKMALELFKPFIISRLIAAGIVHNVRSGSRYIESDKSEVWDILEDIIKDAHVLLNRAPTLHRLGIQAFRPILIEGKAIQIHPLVCAAFNADFDGDQMAVHVPLTEEAKWEAANLMLASKNLLSPARGEPITTPSKDMVWGCFYVTSVPTLTQLEVRPGLLNESEAIIQYNLGKLGLRQKVNVRLDKLSAKGERIAVTTVGRIFFNQILPKEIPFQNDIMGKKEVEKLLGIFFEQYGIERTAEFLDEIKEFGYKWITRSGLSWGLDDVPSLPEKQAVFVESDRRVDECQAQYEMGLLTQSERYAKVIEIWTEAKEKIVDLSKKALNPDGSVASMVNSGARGSMSQLIQIVGMKGLVNNPAGEIIELPVRGNFKEGIGVLEYFISTHGARKGLADTALRTANSGYLTRRLVDVSQDVIIREVDCGTKEGWTITKKESLEMGKKNIMDRVLGRYIAAPIMDAKGKKELFPVNTLIDTQVFKELEPLDLETITVRSVLKCSSTRGVCQKCYGWDLGSNTVVKMGTAVGIIAAQSIGEPGTQLTMRTFHTGGVAGSDITQGLPRVEELFEVRPPKHKSVLSEVGGVAKVEEADVEAPGAKKGAALVKQKVVRIKYRDVEEDKYFYSTPKSKKEGAKTSIKVKAGENIGAGNIIMIDSSGKEVVSTRGGMVTMGDGYVGVRVEADKMAEYFIPVGFKVWVKDGDLVAKGMALTEGSWDLAESYRLAGEENVQKYIIKDIQHIYSSQGQKLNDKHIEIIIRQLFSRISIKDAGETELLPGDVMEWGDFEEANVVAKKAGRELAKGEKLIMGVTKVALTTSSFLSAASFQETPKVLINASLSGKIDYLEGLKENVIIGRLIPVGKGFEKKHEISTAPKEV
ncbi:MAG: DNA-directed RNA polymerase subunit beta' [Parcubacteria group bacterium Gr01-1014_18]|nr:MAG: DNA-directed RNA polymerase subunit beta' [Parcubacteria group bacterium Greene0416_36]TSC80744.1 MAG: DNA-directed RNA polymerase subunit beta' [Parcubacteria group bacterium Gr01-1014_18]TSC98645.1 MAG: DNA-directed RNA polymerase subunit beta' [Parcubacteria group bacterium Greene1014_20]TSD07195.1 MAG: DNA-directed RNA polymerase subunit beta' [Parcubacteria group bacterium Greene0714_2]